MRSERDKAKGINDFESLKKFDQFDLNDDSVNLFYDFTAEVSSMSAQLFFLSKENYARFNHYMSGEMAIKEIEKRMKLLEG